MSRRNSDVTRGFFTKLLELSLELESSNKQIFSKINEAFDVSGMKEGVLTLLFQQNAFND
jgi:hypothetical protein